MECNEKTEFYETPLEFTHALLQRVKIKGLVVEPCSGEGAISKTLEELGYIVLTNDADVGREAAYHRDATEPKSWAVFEAALNRVDWVVTNPPFSRAFEILRLAHATAREGVAMLLRLSFLEPCSERAYWLAQNPPNHLIVLPRTSFTGDGCTDSVTCAWMVWTKDFADQHISVVPRFWADPRRGHVGVATKKARQGKAAFRSRSAGDSDSSAKASEGEHNEKAIGEARGEPEPSAGDCTGPVEARVSDGGGSEAVGSLGHG
jgi:hypothetical protein